MGVGRAAECTLCDLRLSVYTLSPPYIVHADAMAWMNGCCVCTGSLERCTVRAMANVTIYSPQFATESSYDMISVGGVSFSGSSGPIGDLVTAPDLEIEPHHLWSLLPHASVPDHGLAGRHHLVGERRISQPCRVDHLPGTLATFARPAALRPVARGRCHPPCGASRGAPPAASPPAQITRLHARHPICHVSRHTPLQPATKARALLTPHHSPVSQRSPPANNVRLRRGRYIFALAARRSPSSSSRLRLLQQRPIAQRTRYSPPSKRQWPT
jgi:hypothetical protein